MSDSIIHDQHGRRKRGKNNFTDDFTPENDTLLIEDPSLKHGFVQLPRQILRARNLSRDAKILYAVLLDYAWQEGSCFPGYGRLCFEMDASENSVRKFMRELQGVGLVSQRRRGLGKTNIYTLHAISRAQLDTPEPPPYRTSKTEVQEPQSSRTAKTEVQDDAKTEVQDGTKSEVQEPQKLTGNYKQREIETDNNTRRKNSHVNHSDGYVHEGGSSTGQDDLSAESAGYNSTSVTDSEIQRAGEEGVLEGLWLSDRDTRPDVADMPARRREEFGLVIETARDFYAELGDSDPGRSAVAVANLFLRESCELKSFLDIMLLTKAQLRISQQHQPPGQFIRNKGAYYYVSLRNNLVRSGLIASKPAESRDMEHLGEKGIRRRDVGHTRDSGGAP